MVALCLMGRILHGPSAVQSMLRVRSTGTRSFPETKFHSSCFPNRVCDHVSCHCRHPRVGFKCRRPGEPSLCQSTDVGRGERCACCDLENDNEFRQLYYSIICLPLSLSCHGCSVEDGKVYFMREFYLCSV
ncbi:hypothetical protein PYW07_006045 [Mythimna separata]|uniref:Uncharacterized protein n=1 Tax=Mythimna separata TaxID=271217 RepID=A0AAD7YKQ8_MYTSE|nr:hypothetical protein PYW07_006045 [Mythimna separata]